MSGINLDNNVVWVTMVLLSFAWSIFAFDLPIDTVGKQLEAGKVAVFFKAAGLPWLATVFWFVTGVLTASVSTATDSSGNPTGLPVYLIAWLFYGVGIVMLVVGFLHALMWDYPGEELTAPGRKGILD